MGVGASDLVPYGDILSVRSEVLGEDGLLEMIDLSQVNTSLSGRGLKARVPGQALVSDPKHFFNLTYPTEDIQQTLRTLSKVADDPLSSPGTVLLKGHYGSGKSHVLLAAHHALSAPDVVNRWADRWGLPAYRFPDNALVITRNFIQNTTSDLWRLFFDELGRADLHERVSSYPDGAMVEEALGERPVFLILDELERWYDALDGKRQSRNRNFLQALSEVAMRHPRLTFLTSVLGERPEPADTLRRTRPMELAFQSSADRQRVLQYRLFEDRREQPRADIARVVDAYVDAYKQAGLSPADTLRAEMVDAYPFSPELMDILINKVPDLGGFQNTRGTLRFLAKLIRRTHDCRPLLTSQDLPLHDDDVTNSLRNLNSKDGGEVVKRALGDNYKAVGELPHRDELFSAILLYSIADPTTPGATEAQVLTATLDPGENPHTIKDTLRQVREVAFNLHQEGERYLFKVQENPFARINAVARLVPPETCRAAILSSVREAWGDDTRTVIHAGDPDTTRAALKPLRGRRPRYLLATAKLDPVERLTLQNLAEQRNLVLLIEPGQERTEERCDLLNDRTLHALARRMEACGRLIESLPQADARDVYTKERQRARQRLREEVAGRYGFYVTWYSAHGNTTQVDESWYSLERIESFSAASFLTWFKRDFASLGELRTRIKRLWVQYKHKRVDLLIKHFETTPGEPIPYEVDMVEKAVRELARNAVFGLQDDAGTMWSHGRVEKLSMGDMVTCVLVDPPAAPVPPSPREYPKHVYAMATHEPVTRRVKVEWELPDLPEGMHAETLVQRYTTSQAWEVGKPYRMDLDRTHSSNRYLGSDKVFYDTQDLLPGALYTYYVFLVVHYPDKDAVSVLSQSAHVRIQSKDPPPSHDRIVIPAVSGYQAFLSKLEASVMSARNMDANTRIRKIDVTVSQTHGERLHQAFFNKHGAPDGDVELVADFRLVVRGEFGRYDVMKKIAHKLNRFDGALYEATLHLKQPDEDDPS